MSSAKIGTDLDFAIEVLSGGGLVAIPTETVYGLAANAFSPEAVIKIFQAKNRPTFNPLIVHSDSWGKIIPELKEMPPLVEELVERFWPGPLTLLLPKGPRIPDLVTAGNPRVAIRIPSHPLTRNLLSALPFPLAAPSANPFGYISPTTAQHVADQLGDKVDYILDGGPAQVGLESTILGYEGEKGWHYFRKGGVSLDEIEAITGPLRAASKGKQNPQSSGMLKSHYAPHTPLITGDLDSLISQHAEKRLGVIVFQRAPGPAVDKTAILSSKGDLMEAARNAVMHEMDQAGLDLILAEPVPAHGLGLAINDRLQRAEAERKSS